MNLSRPRFTVRSLMLVVVLVAVDFVIVRRMLETSSDIGIAYATLPMANALFLVAPWAWGGGAKRNFWFGFEIAGWLIVVLFGYLSHSHAQTFFRPANSVYPWITIKNIYIQTTYLFSIDCLVYTPPQILVAWLVGSMFARFKQV
jgi:hypothetical protein